MNINGYKQCNVTIDFIQLNAHDIDMTTVYVCVVHYYCSELHKYINEKREI